MLLTSLTAVLIAHATTNCGIDMSFPDGLIDCGQQNPNTTVEGWALVRHRNGKSWWLDTQTNHVWGPTHAYRIADGPVAFSFDAAEKACRQENAELPTLDDYISAFQWRYANAVLKNSEESVLGPKPVFWARSPYLKSKNYWVSFSERNELNGSIFQPVSNGFGADFRCVYR